MSHNGGSVFEFHSGERDQLDDQLERFQHGLSRLVIAIDGPAGSGKSSTARVVAARLGLRYLDTGAMYRAVTYAALQRGIDVDDADAMARLSQDLDLDLGTGEDGVRVRLDGIDVSDAIRSPEVGAQVSRVSAHAGVRRDMLARQRRMAQHGGTLMDGRDIGSVVLPDADLKVFLTASVQTRAQRRLQQDNQRGLKRSLSEVEAEIRQRDELDTSRDISPLVRADDAHLLDTSDLDFTEQVQAILALAVRVVRARRQHGRGPEFRAEDWRQDGYRSFHQVHFRLAHQLLGRLVHAWFGLEKRLDPAARIEGSVLVACNHISNWDPPLVGSALPFESHFVAKRELFRFAPLGRLIRAFNAFPIRRRTADYEALDHAIELLQSQRNVLMFPEGTRYPPGDLGPPRWGFGYVALRAGRPIVPAFVRGTRDKRPRGLRQEPMEVWLGEPFTVTEMPGAENREKYERIGQWAMRRIEALMLRSAGRRPMPQVDLGKLAGGLEPPQEGC